MRSFVSSAALALMLGGCLDAAPVEPSAPAVTVAVPPGAPETVAVESKPAAPLPPEAGDATGPRGTAGAGTPTGYDRVGYASWYGEELSGRKTATGERFSASAVTAAHRDLPLGSFAEVTSLDTGRTVLVRITDRGPSRRDREIDLSAGALKQLGGAGGATPVRVRAVMASPGDQSALIAGEAASPRLDTPEPVLRALRRQLPARGASASAAAARPAAPPKRIATSVPPVPVTPRRPASIDGPASQPAAATSSDRYVVQVAAFSGDARAMELATRVGGKATAGDDGLWRVRLGPFPDVPTAKQARDAVAARGYGDASIQVAP